MMAGTREFRVILVPRNTPVMKKIFFVLVISFFAIEGSAQLSVMNLRLENRINPVGMDVQTPRFSWQLNSGGKNLMQTAYEIRVTNKSGKSAIWNSGKQTTDQSVYVPYSGRSLQSATTYYWQVRVWDNKGNISGWSDQAFWQTGLLQKDDWKAKWIESGSPADSVNGPALLFRKPFLIRKKIISATAFITAHGMYEASVNGRKIGDAFLTPGWTSYNKRLQYQAYDITDMMAMGENVIGITVGSGWYRTPLAWNDNKNLYGKKLGLLLQLNITYSDGSQEMIISDKSWKATDQGPIRFFIL
jgi:alpha-L-rhamnosidase